MVSSSANYWVVLLSDVVGALAFLMFGLYRFSGLDVVAGVAVIVGFMTWGLLEYVLHRWVLLPALTPHGKEREAAIETRAKVAAGPEDLMTWDRLSLLKTPFMPRIDSLTV